MTTLIGIRQNIKTFNDLEIKFSLKQTENDYFFPEWEHNLPQLNEQEIRTLKTIKRRYDYHRSFGNLLEGTVNLLVVSPLLEIAGFFDPPFKIYSPESVTFTIDDPDEIIQGMIDVLVVQNNLWVLVIESKRNSIPLPSALPQVLAYMMCNSDSLKPTFGMVTNGDGFLFVKLSKHLQPEYDVSREFSLFPRRHELYDVLKIIKNLSHL